MRYALFYKDKRVKGISFVYDGDQSDIEESLKKGYTVKGIREPYKESITDKIVTILGTGIIIIIAIVLIPLFLALWLVAWIFGEEDIFGLGEDRYDL